MLKKLDVIPHLLIRETIANQEQRRDRLANRVRFAVAECDTGVLRYARSKGEKVFVVCDEHASLSRRVSELHGVIGTEKSGIP